MNSLEYLRAVCPMPKAVIKKNAAKTTVFNSGNFYKYAQYYSSEGVQNAPVTTEL